MPPPPTDPILSGWTAANMRFTVFASTPPELGKEKLFEEFFSISPDSVTEKRAEFSTEVSSIKGGIAYELSILGKKYDYKVTAIFDPENPPATFPILPTEELDSTFRMAAKTCLSHFPGLQRVAMGEQLLYMVPSRADAYQKLGHLLELNLDDSASDFQYRINRPREHSLSNGVILMINRLATWNALRRQAFFSLPTGFHETQTLGDAISVQTDVNTSNASASLLTKVSVEEQKDVIDLLFTWSREIAEKGHKP